MISGKRVETFTVGVGPIVRAFHLPVQPGRGSDVLFVFRVVPPSDHLSPLAPEVVIHPAPVAARLWSNRRMSEQAYQSLLSSLDQAVDILSRHRTPDPTMTAAFDTLKQARAKIVRAVHDLNVEPLDRAPFDVAA